MIKRGCFRSGCFERSVARRRDTVVAIFSGLDLIPGDAGVALRPCPALSWKLLSGMCEFRTDVYFD